MKSTLLFICSLLCIAFFSWQLVITGNHLPPSADAFSQVVDAKAAEALLLSQQSFNSGVGILNLCLTVLAMLASVLSLFFLHTPRPLKWLRGSLLTANIIILISCVVLFLITLMESMQHTPQCLALVWPWKHSFWEIAIKHVQQAGMFLGLCCGMLGGVNCAAFYYARARRRMYNGE